MLHQGCLGWVQRGQALPHQLERSCRGFSSAQLSPAARWVSTCAVASPGSFVVYEAVEVHCTRLLVC